MATTSDDSTLVSQYDDPTMPANAVPSEAALLGAVLMRGIGVAARLIPEDFYRAWHGELFKVLVDLYARHPEVDYLDPIAVKDELFRLGRANEATPMVLLYDDAISRWVDPAYHVERILGRAEKRLAQRYGQRLAQIAGNPASVEQVMTEMRDAIAALRSRGGLDGDIEEARLDNIVREIRLAAATAAPAAMTTGLPDLDSVLNGGLRPGTFNVLGARPGVGKSLLAGCVGLTLGRTQETRVVYVTLELAKQEVTNRMLANLASVDLTRLQNRHLLGDMDHYRAGLAEEDLQGWPIYVEEKAKTLTQIEDVARLHLRGASSGLLVVDFLQRILPEEPGISQERHIGQCSTRLAHLARELGVAVLCVVSFNRDSVRRATAPRMDDIRESGTVESDADTVMLMWAPKSDQPNSIELVIDKNRYGDTKSIRLLRQGSRARFTCVARDLGEWAA